MPRPCRSSLNEFLLVPNNDCRKLLKKYMKEGHTQETYADMLRAVEKHAPSLRPFLDFAGQLHAEDAVTHRVCCPHHLVRFLDCLTCNSPVGGEGPCRCSAAAELLTCRAADLPSC